MTEKYLVKLKVCYADEFDVEATTIMSKDDVDVIKRHLEREKKKQFKYGEGKEYYFGTNEFVYLSERDFKFQPISDDDIKVLKRLEMKSTGFVHVIDMFRDNGLGFEEEERDSTT